MRLINADKLDLYLLSYESLEFIKDCIDREPTVEQYTDCKQKMPPEKRKEEWGTDESDVVRVVIENTGGGVTTYECGYDYTINGKWNDGDGTSGRTTIAWKFD